MRKHRDQKPVPQDPAERAALLRWLLEHPLWTYPVSLPAAEVVGEVKGNVIPVMFEAHKFSMGNPHECWTIHTDLIDPNLGFPNEADVSQNTRFRVAIEAGPWVYIGDDEDEEAPPEGWTPFNCWGPSYDPRLDCEADSLEEALLELATLVEVFYEGRVSIDITPCGELGLHCVPHPDGFCLHCGFASLEDEDLSLRSIPF